MDEQLQIVEQRLPETFVTQLAPALAVSDLRQAVALLVLGARLSEQCPLEWVDMHESRESFLRYLESKKRGESPAQPAPKAVKTWNFDGRAVPKPKVVKGFSIPLETLNAEFDSLLDGLPPTLRDAIREAVMRLMMRCAHETLMQREWLACFTNSMPENAKFDGINRGRRVVRIGKNSSAELRQRYLSTLPPE